MEQNIHDFHFNHTRFFVLSKTKSYAFQKKRPYGTSENNGYDYVTNDDRSGALHQVLSVFAWSKLNLSKIESRPLKTGLGEYFFIIDVLEDENEPMMKGAMEELHALGCSVKSLGTYYTYNTPE